MGQLDASIVTVAFPTLQRSFHASVESVTWVGLTYLIVLIGGVTAVGRVADTVGRKLLYTYGFVVFTLGSGLCAIAPSLLALDAFRVVQGLGAAMLQANSVAIVYLAMPRQRLGRGIGVQGAAQALGLALGPAVGGLLLATGGWRLIFLVNVPAGIIGTAAVLMLVPRSRELQQRAPFDWGGLALFFPSVASLLVVCSFGSRWGWSSPASVLSLTTTAVLAVCFVAHERRSRAPMLDISLFRSAPFSRGLASGLLSYAVLFGTMFAVPFFLESERGLGPAHVGLLLTTLPVAIGVVAPAAGRITEEIGSRGLTVTGLLLTSASLAVLGLGQPSGWLLAVNLGLVGAGLGLFVPPNNASIMASAPRRHAGSAGGVLNMTRGLGTALGLALTALVLGTGSGAAAASGASPAAGVQSGFEAACFFLAALAAVAALVALGTPRVLRRQAP
jgi:EmrB/QacA subfamily drug resistance transporter